MKYKQKRLFIPKTEYQQRIKNIQSAMEKEGIDVLLTHSCHCESSNVRYLSNFWTVFDFAGVLIPRKGNAILLTGGPEAYDLARDYSMIDDVRIHPLYVETSAPDWDKPTEAYDFKKILDEIREDIPVEKIGIANSNIIPYKIIKDLEKGAGNATLEDKDDLIIKVRWYKSDAEIDILREAYRITEEGIKETVAAIKPGITEWELEAKWRSVVYQMGAEGTSYPIWVTSGRHTYQSLSKSTDRVIAGDEMIQLTFGAKYNGYCGNMVRPVVMGDIPREQEKMVEIALFCLKDTLNIMDTGVPFSIVYDRFQSNLADNGYKGLTLYGPAHGTGLQECEGPWVDNRTDLVLEPNMVLNVDIWIADDNYGVRFEDGVVVTEDGLDILTNYGREIIRL